MENHPINGCVKETCVPGSRHICFLAQKSAQKSTTESDFVCYDDSVRETIQR